ncbi:MAG: glycosyltransferase family 4 protein [Lacipirellulaceae bacterium]
MRVVQLLASPFYGGPERQVLGMSCALPEPWETTFLSFAEGGKSSDFVGRARAAGFEAEVLQSNWPHFRRAAREVADWIAKRDADVLCTNGYKPDLLGLLAARRAGVPAVSIAHGWTGATWKVRLNEWADARAMARFDAVVGVSEATTRIVRRAGVPATLSVTIPNAVNVGELAPKNEVDRRTLVGCFPQPPRLVLVAAGRLSPEKGVEVLLEAASIALPRITAAGGPDLGIAVFGGGVLREALEADIARRRLGGRVVLGGFRNDLDRLLPQADGFVLSSHTEGLPVVLLEAMGAGVAPIATDVGGVGEVVLNNETGLLVPPADPRAFADAIVRLVTDEGLRSRIAARARALVVERHAHELQAQRFADLFAQLASTGRRSSTR